MKNFTGKEILKKCRNLEVISDVSSLDQSLRERNGQAPKFQKKPLNAKSFPGRKRFFFFAGRGKQINGRKTNELWRGRSLAGLTCFTPWSCPSSRINDSETPAGNKECKTEFPEDIVRRQMDRWT